MTDAERVELLDAAIARYEELGWKLVTQLDTRAELGGRGALRRYLEVLPDGTLEDRLFDGRIELPASDALTEQLDVHHLPPSRPVRGQPARLGSARVFGLLCAGVVAVIALIAVVGTVIGGGSSRSDASLDVNAAWRKARTAVDVADRSYVAAVNSGDAARANTELATLAAQCASASRLPPGLTDEAKANRAFVASACRQRGVARGSLAK